MLRVRTLAAALCGSVALLTAAPAAAEEWSQARAAYYTGKYHAKQAAKAVLNLVIPSAHAQCPGFGNGPSLGGNGRGNNGFGNGGNDPAPGNSGHNNSPNAAQKLADIVR
jgi:hypothetical protein